MPVPSPGERLRFEEELGELLAPLREICRLLNIPPHLWDRSPAIALLFESAAAAKLAERIMEERRCGWKTAVDAAASQLKIPPDTLQSRLKRWRSATLTKAA